MALPLPSDRWVRLLLPAALIFFAGGSDRNYQTDLWHHLARGRAIVESGQLLDEDRFTFTVHSQPLRDVNWGWQVIFFKLFEIGGLPLVQTANAALLALMMLLLTYLSWRRSGSLLAAMCVSLFVFFGLWQLILIRPQTFSLLLFVVLIGVLDSANADRRWLLAPPFIMAIWVNVHGGFPIGLVLIGAHWLAAFLEVVSHWRSPSGESQSEGRRASISTWSACLLASTLATLANPYGWGVYEYVLQTAGRAATRHIDEWLPPAPNQLTGFVWLLSLAALLVLFATGRQKPSRRELTVLCCLLPFASGSIRMVAWWLLVAAPILADQVAGAAPVLADRPTDTQPTRGSVLTFLALCFAMLLATPWLERYNPALLIPAREHRAETDLQAIADQLSETKQPCRIFTRFSWGEYLGWALPDQGTVFMDGRIEIITDPIWLDYMAISRGRADWQKILDRYQVTHLVLDTATGQHAELLPLVRRSSRWREVATAGDAALFERLPNGVNR